MDARVDEKKQRLLSALEKGMAQLHLDARRPGVLVPEKYKQNHHLVLNVSYRFDPPDLTVSDWGVRETLSFGGSRFTVGVPWSAVYAIASHVSREFWMYPDDMPQELAEAATERINAEELQVQAGARPRPEGAEAEKNPRAILREVVLDKPEGADAGGPTEQTPPRRGHLRIVK
ncbi:MAG: ClpXP protease specificity-enhancing factor SspB [Myxococcota bacterium]